MDKNSSLESIYEKNKEKIKEVAEENTKRNKDGETVISKEEIDE